MGKASRLAHRLVDRHSTPDSAIGLASPPVDRSVTFEEMDRALVVLNSHDGSVRLVCRLCGSLTINRWDNADKVSTSPTAVSILAACGTHARTHISPADAGAHAASAANTSRVDL